MKWFKNGEIIEKFSDIKEIIYKKEGRQAILEDAEKSINGEYSFVEEPIYDRLNMFLFKKAYKQAYVDGFQRGFEEGGLAKWKENIEFCPELKEKWKEFVSKEYGVEID